MTFRSDSGRIRALTRVGVTAAAALLLLTALAGPALAHGGGGEDASNYRSVVDVIATPESAADPSEREAVDVEGVTWAVLANDSLLQVSNATSDELTVPGYE